MRYSKGHFKEGVLPAADDELKRWQKCEHGCTELLFYPLKDWWCRGPINHLSMSTILIFEPKAFLSPTWTYGNLANTTLLFSYNQNGVVSASVPQAK